VVSIALFITAAAYFAYRVVVSTTHSVPETKAVYRPGETLDDVSALHLGKVGMSAIVVISPTCRYCKESLPLYQELGAIAGSPGGAFRLVFVTVGDEAATKQMLDEGGIPGHELLRRPTGLRVGSVPTVLLADPSGKVSGAWTGRLEGSSRSDLLRSARAAASH
jgi:hypothetical protein